MVFVKNVVRFYEILKNSYKFFLKKVAKYYNNNYFYGVKPKYKTKKVIWVMWK